MSDGRHSADDGPEHGSTWFSQPAGGSGDGGDTSPTGTPQRGEPGSGAPKGRIRQQDGSTTPREPSLAEKRAREQKLRADREAVRLKEARSKTTKRVLIGTGATIGVVALIAGIYAASSPDEEIVAQCVDANQVVVPDENCAGPQTNGQVSDGGGGFAFVPIFLGGGGGQYHYNYGSNGRVGQVATGGTVNPPPAASKSGTTVRSGTSGSTISRGGLGVGGSSSSSGSSGSSSGS
ncbi:hypothetical protein [Pseudonocardia parietis]|uniref:Uncharacterized protein n=1 Tax=Pseudonocardia parietis TaxID=570936 RepID=A0ABS4VLA0_9PSEU|nr:hypothetical protein [Pseudonocardia parietis]MBP2364701.1 hypothetical protein [Pseudonocardia parietis]